MNREVHVRICEGRGLKCPRLLGGITPLGLPDGWPIVIDQAVAETDTVVIGSGVRRSKLWIPGPALATLVDAEVLEGLGLALDGPARA